MKYLKPALIGAAAFIVTYCVFAIVDRVRCKIAEKRGKHIEPLRFKIPLSINKMDVFLIAIAVYLVWFNNKMISLFELYQTVPDTLIPCVYAATGGECGAMAWIKTTQERNRDRKWQLEDEKRIKETREASVADNAKGG